MICVKNLTKKYGANLAVRNLTFEIEDGKVYGFLGPNGAGKSTTLNMITGCLAATEGTVTVDGFDIFEDAKEAKRLIGYLPEIPPLYVDFTPYEYLRFVAQAKGIKADALEKNVSDAMEETQLTQVANRLIKNLSKGYRQRVGIAQAMLGNPKFVILDEPTVGLDPIQIIEIRNLIRAIAKDRTVILSSHILAEVQEVCDELIIIANGGIVSSGTIEQIQQNLVGDNTLNVTAKEAPGLDAKFFDGIAGVRDVSEQRCEEGCVHFSISVERGADIREAVFRRFCDSGNVLLEMSADMPTLEDIFLRLTEQPPQEDAETPAVPPSAAEAAELLVGGGEEDSGSDDAIGEEAPGTQNESDSAPDQERSGDSSENNDDDGYQPQFR